LSAGGQFKRTLPDGTVQRFTKIVVHSPLEENGQTDADCAINHYYLTTVTDRDGNVTTYAYDGSGHLTSITDSVGEPTRVVYVGSHVHQIIDPANRVTTLDYDSNGNLTKVTDPDTYANSYKYDDKHHLTSQVSKLVDAQGQPVADKVVYDPNSGRAIQYFR